MARGQEGEGIKCVGEGTPGLDVTPTSVASGSVAKIAATGTLSVTFSVAAVGAMSSSARSVWLGLSDTLKRVISRTI